jgi:hypothetical protein
MTTIEIPRVEWAKFFDGFNSRHKGWLVTTELIGDGTRCQVEARDLPLEGIIPDLRIGSGQMEIVVGNEVDAHLSHTVTSPTHVLLSQTAEGADESVEIQSIRGTVVVRFRSAILPEMVDGL